MKKKYDMALFIFRRDLRIDDNTGLIAAQTSATTVLPCFIIDPAQVTKRNHYKSNNALQFMFESLLDLTKQFEKRGGRLYLFYGKPSTAVQAIVKQTKAEAVFVNRDYTPYNQQRDQQIAAACTKSHVDWCVFADALLHEPEMVTKKDGSPYTIFTPFFKRARTFAVRPVQPKPKKNGWFTKPLKGQQKPALFKKLLPTTNKSLWVNGGRASTLRRLKGLKRFTGYAKKHDYPEYATTGLSAHLKFGTCSIREVYAAIANELGLAHPLIRQLYWRDFFTHIAYHFPAVFGNPFHATYQKLTWQNKAAWFKAWCNGTTGFPIVDAGMRQLNATGFMHNRVRMVVASFLTKDLHIDWQWGERYFAQKLVDYDPSVNNGNWQWAASTGCDAQPYFRIFNPWIQQKRFDPQCAYIKQWVPELKALTARQIHAWPKTAKTVKTGYPKPLVDHATEAAVALRLYRKAAQKRKI
jgi:deoxyribodipyrimidine photo-lyase